MTRMRILAVTHPSVAHPMTLASTELVNAGMDVRMTTAATFNAGGPAEPDVDILLVSNAARCDTAALSRFPVLIGVVFIASGTESADIDAASERGIVVAHGHSAENAESMAEATVLLMLAVLYDLHRAERILRDNLPPPPVFSRMLKGRVVGLIGYGRIARGVAARLAPWGTRLLVATRSPPASMQPGMEEVDLETLMRRSDVVSVHAALNEGTRGMIGRRHLELLRPGSVFINTSRGGLVDEQALLEIAIERELWLGLDTFEREPLPNESPLRTLPRAILTPHLVGHTLEGQASLIQTVVANVQCIAKGITPVHARNWDRIQAASRPPADARSRGVLES